MDAFAQQRATLRTLNGVKFLREVIGPEYDASGSSKDSPVPSNPSSSQEQRPSYRVLRYLFNIITVLE